MCCEPERHHGGRHRGHHHRRHHGHHRGCCCCGEHFPFGPSFWTTEKKIAMLEEYLEGLREEANAVEEHIAEMKEEK